MGAALGGELTGCPEARIGTVVVLRDAARLLLGPEYAPAGDALSSSGATAPGRASSG
jgi:hypothetical protein